MKPLVIFDCDGVLVDSETIASEIFAQHLTQAGHPHTAARCREQFTGLSLTSCQQRLLQHQIIVSDDFFVRMQQETFNVLAEKIQPIAAVQSVLRFLQAEQWPCCVASSGSMEKMQLTLGKTALLPYFEDRLFSADSISRGKPAPDLFLYAASTLGYAPAQCVVVEDSLPGIQAAVAAGMRVCAFGAQHVAGEGVHVFSCMSELPTMLMALER